MKVHFREAEIGDHPFIYHVRNDPYTREMSLSTGEIDERQSLEWFKEKLQDETYRIFVAYTNNPFDPFGVVRLQNCLVYPHNPRDKQRIISWMVCPSKRKQGLGTKMVEQFCSMIGSGIMARIKVKNSASLGIAYAVGFKNASFREEVADGLSTWVK